MTKMCLKFLIETCFCFFGFFIYLQLSYDEHNNITLIHSFQSATNDIQINQESLYSVKHAIGKFSFGQDGAFASLYPGRLEVGLLEIFHGVYGYSKDSRMLIPQKSIPDLVYSIKLMLFFFDKGIEETEVQYPITNCINNQQIFLVLSQRNDHKFAAVKKMIITENQEEETETFYYCNQYLSFRNKNDVMEFAENLMFVIHFMFTNTEMEENFFIKMIEFLSQRDHKEVDLLLFSWIKQPISIKNENALKESIIYVLKLMNESISYEKIRLLKNFLRLNLKSIKASYDLLNVYNMFKEE